MGDGTVAVLQESHPMHYQDAAGNWRRIDPAFKTTEGGWTNTSNAFHSSVGQEFQRSAHLAGRYRPGLAAAAPGADG